MQVTDAPAGWCSQRSGRESEDAMAKRLTDDQMRHLDWHLQARSQCLIELTPATEWSQTSITDLRGQHLTTAEQTSGFALCHQARWRKPQGTNVPYVENVNDRPAPGLGDTRWWNRFEGRTYSSLAAAYSSITRACEGRPCPGTKLVMSVQMANLRIVRSTPQAHRDTGGQRVTAPVIVGVDPGGRYTGIAVRARDQLLDWRLLKRGKTVALHTWCNLCLDAVNEMTFKYGDGADRDHAERYAYPQVAVEEINSPNPHMGIIAVRGLLDTAAVYGAIATTPREIIPVPPGHHGNRFLYAYPKEIGKGKYSTIKHVRAAYDIAGAAQTLLKWQQAATTK